MACWVRQGPSVPIRWVLRQVRTGRPGPHDAGRAERARRGCGRGLRALRRRSKSSAGPPTEDLRPGIGGQARP